MFRKLDNESSRIANWLIGFGIFIFIWFCLSLFIPYSKVNVLISIFILLAISLRYYLSNRLYLNLLDEIWKFKVPLLLVIPLLPAVFVKASLPPYYSDEMAYHFISPFTVLHLESIRYTGGLYADLPRIMNLFYEITFSLTNTYSVTRLLHFSIMVTSLLYAFNVLKSNFKVILGALFVFVFLSIPQDIVLTSTLGYIDVAAYSFLLMGLVSAIGFIINPKEEYLILTFVFWAMNLGTKYTGISSFVTFILIFSGVIILNRKNYIKYLTKLNLLKIMLVFFILGGYWYIKNFVLYGNPIFPFIFSCPWGDFVEKCPASGGFFGDWTTKVNFANSYLILSQLFLKNKILQFMVIISPFLALFIKNKKIKILTLGLFGIVLLELLLLRNFSGFYIRYHQHMQMYLLIGVLLTITAKYKHKVFDFTSKVLLACLVVSAFSYYLFVVTYTNSLKFLNWHEINYSIGKLDIYEWIDFHFPRMKSVIKWCEEGDINNPKRISRYDPDLIWFDYDGLNRSFILNCDYSNSIPTDLPKEKVIDYAKENKLKFHFISANKCIESEYVPPKYAYEMDYQNILRNINNKIVCNSVEVVPYVYYFDYEKI